MTQIIRAREGEITPEVESVAHREGVPPESLRRLVASGEAVVMVRRESAVGIGRDLCTKVNANVGSSPNQVDIEGEVEKARVAEGMGADTISDLSMGGPIDRIRKKIREATTSPLTTLPVYQAIAESGGYHDLARGDLLGTIESHAREGVSSIVVHAGFTLDDLEGLGDGGRVMGMVSKGGSLTAAWMLEHQRGNPFQECFEEIVALCREHDVVLSLGNAMRSGCVHDAPDEAQRREIRENARLARRANDLGAQVIVAGMGGHVHAPVIPEYVEYHKKTTGGRPLFVAGPLPCDVGLGYDHVSAAVGGAIAAGAGADYLCYITPAEHLGLPTVDDVREGMAAARIAAHIGDSIKYGPQDQDLGLAKRRRMLDWPGQLDHALCPERASRRKPEEECGMCGEYCAIKTMSKYIGGI